MFIVQITLFDENNATVEGNDLLLDIQMEITLSSESCLFGKIQLMGKPREHKSAREVPNIAIVHRTAVNFLRILKVSDQLISRDNLQFGTGVQ